MKKIISGLVFAFVLLFNIAAQEKSFEGYDKLNWGTTLESFLKSNPSAIDETEKDDELTNEKVYSIETSTVTRFYRFFDKKLYWGRTVYVDPDNATTDAIVEKMQSIYGKNSDYVEDSDEDCDYQIASWYISPKMTVELEFDYYYDDYGDEESMLVFITYYNEETLGAVYNYEKQQKIKSIEL